MLSTNLWLEYWNNNYDQTSNCYHEPLTSKERKEFLDIAIGAGPLGHFGYLNLGYLGYIRIDLPPPFPFPARKREV